MERMGHTSPAVALRYQHVMADRQAQLASALERVTGIEPASRAWKACALPLSYTRVVPGRGYQAGP
jgi:hypothetical protein